VNPKLRRELERIVGPTWVLTHPIELLTYEYDATIERALPDAVVLPGSAQEVAAVVQVARRFRVPVVARGAGTGLSGGAVPYGGGIVVVTSRLNRILKIDPENAIAVVEPGVLNLDVSRAAAPYGLRFAPDPSSQKACTIGGNIAENAGGPHCLRYGTTTNHVLALEMVTAHGQLVWLGSPWGEGSGYDLVGAVVGSEGTLGIVTKAVLRLLPLPPAIVTLLAIFDTVEQASEAVSAIIAQGIIPAALEMLDKAVMEAVEPYIHAGYPPDAGAVLLIEVEGLEEATEAEAQAVRGLCQELGAREVRMGFTPEERERLWAGRKAALGALGRLAPSYYILDGVVPRTKLPHVVRQVYEICQRYGLRVAHVLHAGDGNLHPNILFDEREPGAVDRVLRCGADIMRACVEAGGSITGEHGVGYEKRQFMPWLFTHHDLEVMRQLKDAFGAGDLLNPHKIFPEGEQEIPMVPQRPAIRQAGPDSYL